MKAVTKSNWWSASIKDLQRSSLQKGLIPWSMLCKGPQHSTLQDWLLGVSFWSLWGHPGATDCHYHFILSSFAQLLHWKSIWLLSCRSQCRQNPPSVWQAVGHHLQHGNILRIFFCLVIFNLDHFSNLFYNLAAQRGARTALEQGWEVWQPSWEQRESSRRSAAFRPWYLTRAKLQHLHFPKPYSKDVRSSAPSVLFYRSGLMPRLGNCRCSQQQVLAADIEKKEWKCWKIVVFSKQVLRHSVGSSWSCHSATAELEYC